MRFVKDFWSWVWLQYHQAFVVGLRAKHYPQRIINKVRESYKIIVITGGIFALSVLIIVGAIAYTSSPPFCKSCHIMKPSYDSWYTSTHSDVGCIDCHSEPGFGNMMKSRLRSGRYAVTYFIFGQSGPMGLQKPSNNVCLQCHIAERPVSATGDILIPHPLHINLKGTTCIDCHKDMVHHRKGKGKNIPSMEICLKCHDGKQATNRCEKCHSEMSYPESHKAEGWLTEHGGQTKTENCNKCHAWRPDWCADCHKKKPPSHVGRWRTNHKLQTKPDRSNCVGDCHNESFCARCHGVMP